MKAWFVLLLLLSVQISVLSQPLRQTREFDSTGYVKVLDSLEQFYGRNKKIPDQYQLPVYIALSHYPELRNTRLIFRKSKITTTLNVRPTVLSVLLRHRHKRKYIVRINNQRDKGQVLLPKVPFNAKIGLFGHEFAHIVDYRSLNAFGMINRSVSYAFFVKRMEYEQQIDYMTIQHGLGWQLYDWSDYVLHQSNASRYYKRMKRFVYLTPEEIEALMLQPGAINIKLLP